MTATNGVVLAVVTRDRASKFERFLLPSLTHASEEGVRILVVDQSVGPETRRLVEGLRDVRYLTSPPGLSRGRNVAVAASTEPLIVFTDDDVSFPGSWVDDIVAVFERVPAAGVVCGRAMSSTSELLPGTAAGTYHWPTSPFGLGSGFNMAFRRAALDAAGPFDEALGAGARYRSGEDTDMLYRIMREGWAVVCSDDISVVHHDWRTGAEQLRLSFSYGLGAGAQTAKHVAMADAAARTIALREARRHVGWLVRKIATSVARELALQVSFLAGLLVGFVRRRRELGGSGRSIRSSFLQEAGVPRDRARRRVHQTPRGAARDEPFRDGM